MVSLRSTPGWSGQTVEIDLDGKAIPYTGPVVWEAIFLLVILKIPVVYLCCVVWWAVRA